MQMTGEQDREGTAQEMLGRGREWYRKGKETLTQKASQFGEVEDMWRRIGEESGHIESVLRDESPDMHQSWLEQIQGTVDWLSSMDPENPRDYWDQPVVEVGVFTGTATSGSVIASTSYPRLRPDQWSDLQGMTVAFTERRHDRDVVAELLSALSPGLGEQFEQAWQTWHSATKDRRKPAMYEMRDALHEAVVHLSRQGGRFRAQRVCESRKARMMWIADNLVSDRRTAQLVRRRAKWYPRLYRQLSGAHQVHFDEGTAHTILVEAQEFLLELLRSLDWDLVEAMGLCHGKA